MKNLYFLVVILFSVQLQAEILTVGINGDGYMYDMIQQAAADANPGDTIMVFEGVYPGGEYIEELNGTDEEWITIMVNPGDEVIYSGGSQAWHLINCTYLRISGFIFESKSVNGVNIDDGGTYETPTHHIIIENCHWRSIDATGNHDELKLSGLNDFVIRNCAFENGSPGGSLVDMVGCHSGFFFDNRFSNGGSNSIQAKGGSSQIFIERNWFQDGGLRAINIGGYTGADFFRPLGATYESREIHVFANVFVGGQAPIAFVGTLNSTVVNNTIINPAKWAIRILQENNEDGILQCANNYFINNIVYLNNNAAGPTLNIGPNTKPETFKFTNNLWYNTDNNEWGGPNLPVTETEGIIGQDPEFMGNSYKINKESPAYKAGAPIDMNVYTWEYLDLDGRYFDDPPSIGAYEADPNSSIESSDVTDDNEFKIQNITGNSLLISAKIIVSGFYRFEIFNVTGNQIGGMTDIYLQDGIHELQLNTYPSTPSGLYFVCIYSANNFKCLPYLK